MRIHVWTSNVVARIKVDDQHQDKNKWLGCGPPSNHERVLFCPYLRAPQRDPKHLVLRVQWSHIPTLALSVIQRAIHTKGHEIA